MAITEAGDADDGGEDDDTEDANTKGLERELRAGDDGVCEGSDPNLAKDLPVVNDDDEDVGKSNDREFRLSSAR